MNPAVWWWLEVGPDDRPWELVYVERAGASVKSQVGVDEGRDVIVSGIMRWWWSLSFVQYPSRSRAKIKAKAAAVAVARVLSADR